MAADTPRDPEPPVPTEADRLRGRLCADALACGAPFPWWISDLMVDDGYVVIRDAENGYVAEVDIGQFPSLTDGGDRQDALAVASLIIDAAHAAIGIITVSAEADPHA